MMRSVVILAAFDAGLPLSLKWLIDSALEPHNKRLLVAILAVLELMFVVSMRSRISGASSLTRIEQLMNTAPPENEGVQRTASSFAPILQKPTNAIHKVWISATPGMMLLAKDLWQSSSALSIKF